MMAQSKSRTSYRAVARPPLISSSSSSSAASNSKNASLSSSSFFFVASSDRGGATMGKGHKQQQKQAKRRLSDGSSSSFGDCPLCGASLPLHRLPFHASECQGEEAQPSAPSSSLADAASAKDKIPMGPDHHDDCDATAIPANHSSSDDEELWCGGGGGGGGKNNIVRYASDRVPTPAIASLLTTTTTTEAVSGPASVGRQRTEFETQVVVRASQRQQDLPPGLFLYEDFISPEEEEFILKELDRGGGGGGGGGGGCDGDSHNKDDDDDDDDDDDGAHDNEVNEDNCESHVPWKVSSFNGSSYGKRWGVHCQLRNRCVTEAERPLPAFVTQIVIPRLRTLESVQTRQPKRCGASVGVVPNEANAIDYRKSLGHWLQSHVDDRHLSKEPIANLSLAGDCIMTYTALPDKSRSSTTQYSRRGPYAKPSNQKGAYRVLLKRRTLQVLTGPARYSYQHGISNADLLSERRVLVTMRESPLTAATGAGPRATTTTTTRPISSSFAAFTASTTGRATNSATAVVPTLAPWWKRRRLVGDVVDSLASHRKATTEPALRPSSNHAIPGLWVLEDFVTPEEEAMILTELENGGGFGLADDNSDNGSPSGAAVLPPPPWKSERHSGVHREKRYGRDSDLWSRAVRDPRHPLPEFVNRIMLPKLRNCRAVRDLLAGWTPNEGNAIEYVQGHSWLKPHVDDRRKHKELIANLSLAGDCYMTFATASASSTGATAPLTSSSPSSTKVLLRRRTLLVLTGKSRYEYTHGINPKDILSARRVSFTLRETV